MTKKTAVAPLKKKEVKYNTLYLCYDPDDETAYTEYFLKEALKYDYYFKIQTAQRSNKPAVNLGTFTLS